jgi:chromosome segregation ATPase
MTLEDKLLDRLERLARDKGVITEQANALTTDLLQTCRQLAELHVQYDQVCSAHDQLKAHAAELEKKLSRKRGGK